MFDFYGGLTTSEENALPNHRQTCLSDKTQFVRQTHTLLFALRKENPAKGRAVSLRDSLGRRIGKYVLSQGKDTHVQCNSIPLPHRTIPDNSGHKSAKVLFVGLFAPENLNVAEGPEGHTGQCTR